MELMNASRPSARCILQPMAFCWGMDFAENWDGEIFNWKTATPTNPNRIQEECVQGERELFPGPCCVSIRVFGVCFYAVCGNFLAAVQKCPTDLEQL
ncbi:hypothetical protein T01_5838 [Trichinella spiralis]|uniref:Uncharacterized protein n=1 Tax=Trichinella spiralis TaxID=6334 RepID=A0A0V1AX15_TRISP|nr:hypothetical protein T01_5838 [Trichinella spiralis]